MFDKESMEIHQLNYTSHDHYIEMLFQRDVELPQPSKYCCGCGRWLSPDEKWFYATSSRKDSSGQIKYTKRLICAECKEDGIDF